MTRPNVGAGTGNRFGKGDGGLESWASFPDRPNSLPNSNVVMMTRELGHLRVVGQIQHLFVDDRGAKDGHRVFQKSIFLNFMV